MIIDKSLLTKQPAGTSFLENITGKKILYAVLIVILAVEVVWAFRTLNVKNSISSSLTKINRTSGAVMVVEADKKEVAAGDTFNAKVRIFTGGHMADAVDSVLKYDPEMLEITSSDQIQKGSMYKEYPLLVVDKGTVRVSAITAPDQDGFNGAGHLATVTFKAKKAGLANLELDYNSGSTTDSNVVEGNNIKDILSRTVNAQVRIVEAGVTPKSAVQTNSNAKICQGFTQYCLNEKGQVGTQKCIQGVEAEGSCGYDPELTQTCSECIVR